MKTVFWVSLGLIVYTYAGYPFLLYLIGRIRRWTVRRAPYTPFVSIIIAAHNEEDNLRAKLTNTLALRYPPDKREVIVVSDGSTDATEAIAAEFASDGVKCLRLSQRLGKAAALNEGVRSARGEVLVFTDVGALGDPGCLEEILPDFADPSVGCVSTEDAVVGEESGVSEGAYVRYEMLLRRLESLAGSCVAVSGSFYAARARLCPRFPSYAATDLLSAVESVRCGYRVISEPRARAAMGTVPKHGDEFRRKVRTVLTGIACLPQMVPLLNPVRYGLFSLELVSHKLLRWGGGIFLLPLFLSSAYLAPGSRFYAAAFGLQILGYLLASLGILFEGAAKRSALVRLPLFFVSVNLSALVACWKYLTGERAAVWQPSKRRHVEETTV